MARKLKGGADSEVRKASDASYFSDVFADLAPADLARHFLVSKPLRVWPLPSPTKQHVIRAEALLAGHFTYIGETHHLRPGFSWKRNPSIDKEWQIAHHKHYFAIDLCQAWRLTGERRYLDGWVDLTSSWLDEMGSGFISASDAQVEAKRLESWITAYLVLRQAETPAPLPSEFICRLIARFGSEAAYISRNLKPSRNHRTFQLYAMFLTAVLFPELAVSADLRDLARDELVGNLLRDFAKDGVHVERSTHYHNITLETALGFVELARLNGIAVPDELDRRLRRALDFATFALLPDGEIPLIGDSDTLDHSSMFEAGYRLYHDDALLWAATQGASGTPPASLSREFGGYFILTSGHGRGRDGFRQRQHVFFDCAPLGEGSHSHYDLFSVCWSEGGKQVVVDPGRYTYYSEPDAAGTDWRHVFKSTRSHNTIEIDECDQTRYYSKAARPALGRERYDRAKHMAKHGPEPDLRGKCSSLGHKTDWIMATAVSHEYRPRHTRAVVFMQRQYVVLLDHVAIDDAQQHTCIPRLHFAAEWLGQIAVQPIQGGALARAADWTIAIASPMEDQSVHVEQGWVSRAYGVKERAPVLTMPIVGSQSPTLCTLLIPGLAGDKKLELAGVSWSMRAPGQAPIVAVDIRVDGTTYRDLFMLAPSGEGHLAAADLNYTGSLVACRIVGGRVHYVAGMNSRSCALGSLRFADGAAFEWRDEPH